MTLLRYDPTNVFLPDHGLSRGDLAGLSQRLAAAREVVLADAQLWASGGPVPQNKQPLDAGFFELPERTLAAYRQQGDASELGRIL